MNTNLETLEGIVDLQCADGTWNFNSYHFGLANGLLLALAVVRGEEPEFLDAPDGWLEDEGGIVPEPMAVSYDTVDGKWWMFVGGAPLRPLTDEEAADVVWGTEET